MMSAAVVPSAPSAISTAKAPATHAPTGEHRGDGGAGLERLAESAQRVAVRAGAKRFLAHPAPFARVEPEAEQWRHERPFSAPATLDRDKLGGVGIAHDEQHVEDPQGPAALDPLDRADQPALELGSRRESIDEQLRGGRRAAGSISFPGHVATSLGPRARVTSAGPLSIGGAVSRGCRSYQRA